MSGWIASPARRALDVSLAASVLAFLSVPMLIIGACIRLTSRGRAVFFQDRLGKGGRLFRIYKFRSMYENRGENAGSRITKAGDSRVTPLGKYLRNFKLDELPQFFNILRGDMSLVGPRPKLSEHTSLSNMPYRPGITGEATIAFRREEDVLRTVDPDEMDSFYSERIKPLKARLDVCYMCKATLHSDLRVIGATFLHCVALTRNSSAMRSGGTGASRIEGISPKGNPEVTPIRAPSRVNALLRCVGREKESSKIIH